MKKVLDLIWPIYVGIGVLFSIPVLVSYIYSETYLAWHLGWDVFTSGGVVVLSVNAFMMALAPALRVAFWLPSLILFCLNGKTGFWEWLAPGFFVTAN